MLLFLACTTGGDSPADTQDTEVDSTDPATVELAGECPMAIDHGGFLVAAYTDYSIVDGRFADGVVPLERAEGVGDLLAHVRGVGVQLVGTVHRDRCDAVFLLEKNVVVAHG